MGCRGRLGTELGCWVLLGLGLREGGEQWGGLGQRRIGLSGVSRGEGGCDRIAIAGYYGGHQSLRRGMTV